MSRALDQDAKASTSALDSYTVYTDIVKAISPNTSALLDIELLGKSHPLPPGCNVLVDGNSIAIPKLKLIQGFVIARQLFFKCLKDFKEDKFQDIRNTTAVILLLDPEHITAANARKRVIEQHAKGSKAGLEVAFRRELLAIDSFLTSRLHRHTKSPTLWGHRRWLLEISKSMSFAHNIQRDLETVVLVAAERHPRNYYAWLHMRWVLQNFQHSDNSGEPTDSNASKIVSIVKDWCLRHPGDTSGWSFLLFCLFSPESSNTPIEINSSICKEVLGLAASFQWTHESVWVFLRTLVATGEIEEEQRVSFFKIIEATVSSQPEDSKARAILVAAKSWCIDNSV
jgi:hypothetical protein